MLFPKGYSRLGLCSPKGPATTGISRNERRGRTTTRACQTNPILGRGSIRLNVAQKKAKVILRNALFDLIMFGSVTKRNKTQTVFMSNV